MNLEQLGYFMIAHVDGDAFFASVLERQNPLLRVKPLLVLGMGGGSCVIAANYLAKQKGVKTGMPVRDAKKLLSDFNAVPAAFLETGVASEHIEEILHEACADIECASIDEWYLNLRTASGGTPRNFSEWAVNMQKRLMLETGLPISIGVAPTKLLAKMASDFRKPKGITVVTKEKSPEGLTIDLESFLRQSDVSDIPGIGARREVHVRSLGWNTAWEFLLAETGTIVHVMGRPGAEMQEELKGNQVFDVVTERAPPKSVSRCRTFKSTRNKELLRGYMLEHLSYIVRKMRKYDLACQLVAVTLRKPSYEHAHSDVKTLESLTTEERILPYVERCFARVHEPGNMFNQIGVMLGHLKPVGPLQYSLFEGAVKPEKSEKVQASLDELRDRYGRDIIRRGAAAILPQRRKELPIIE